MAPRIMKTFLALALVAPAVAAAQPGAAPPRLERHGLLVGGGLFGGNISCDGADCGDFREAGGVAGFVGYNFTPKLGALLDIWAMTSSQNDVALTFVTATVNLRWYPVPIFWVQGGVGNGHAVISIGGLSARGDDVPVGQLAAGVEVVRARNWALDVSLRVAQGGSTDDNGDVTTGRSAGLGVNFTYFATRQR